VVRCLLKQQNCKAEPAQDLEMARFFQFQSPLPSGSTLVNLLNTANAVPQAVAADCSRLYTSSLLQPSSRVHYQIICRAWN